MPYWKTRGLRGSAFEELINKTNELYDQRRLAIIQKIPTPITPVELDSEAHNIKLAYFDKKSTVDYIGVVQGIPICFDAKETGRKSFPLQNIHEHQMFFMNSFTQQKGVAFLLVHFLLTGEVFFLPYESLRPHWDRAEAGGRKSIPYEYFDAALRVEGRGGFPVHYLEALNTYLVSRG